MDARALQGRTTPVALCSPLRVSMQPMLGPRLTEQPVSIDRETRRRFIRVVKNFLTSEVRWWARGLFALLFAFALAVNGLNVVNSYVGRDFMTAIAHRNRTGFIQQAVLYIGVFAASTVVAVLYRFTEERLGLFWRACRGRRVA
jgi:putative ATP-binding cassette transporter